MAALLEGSFIPSPQRDGRPDYLDGAIRVSGCAQFTVAVKGSHVLDHDPLAVGISTPGVGSGSRVLWFERARCAVPRAYQFLSGTHDGRSERLAKVAGSL